ncbi:MAG: hypothetical protein KBB83_06010 [Alphaproteobacteria bacterium]|nr:hypothetical protein [Alphaproteobacteria bacterium]
MVKIYTAIILCFLGISPVKAGGGGGEAKAAESTLAINDLIIPVIIRAEVAGFYSLGLTIEAKEESTRETLAHFGPRIRDAIICDLYVILPLMWSKDSNPDINIVKKRLEKTIKKTVPEDTIGLVSINTFQMSAR